MATPMPAAEPVDVRGRILRNAMSLFARHGYAGTSVREIAEVSKLTKAGLYHHFPDKPTLYRAAIRETSAYLEARITSAIEGLDEPARQVRALLHAEVILFREEGHLVRLFYNNLFMGAEETLLLDEDLKSPDRALGRALAACADRGLVAPEHVSTVATLLAGGLEFVGATWLIHPERAAPTFALADRLLAVAAPRIAWAAGIQESPSEEKGHRS